MFFMGFSWVLHGFYMVFTRFLPVNIGPKPGVPVHFLFHQSCFIGLGLGLQWPDGVMRNKE